MLKGYLRFGFVMVLMAFASLLKAQTGTWAIGLGSPVQDYPEDVLVDDQCNTYVAGFFRDTLELGGSTLVSAGQSDIFLAKFDCNGDLLWNRRFGWHENEFARCLEFDAQGNILLVGEYQDSTILANDTVFSLDTLWYGPYAGTYDILVMEIDPSGNLLGYKADGWFGSESFYDVAVDSRNFKLFSGMFRTYTYWGGGVWGRGYDDGLMVLMDTTANFVWKGTAWGRYIDKATGVDIIGDSLYVMGGTFQDTCYFRDSTVFSITDFEDDVFVSCWDSSRNFRWNVVGHGPGKDHLDALESDSDGNIYICGRFDSTFALGGLTINSQGNLDGYVAKLSPDGIVLWLQAVGGVHFDAVSDLTVSDNNKILLTGYFQGGMEWGGQVLQASDSLDQDVFVSALDINGNVIWLRRAGGSSIDKGNAIDVDANGLITVTGAFSGTAYFGQQRLSSYGGEDIFVMRMLSDGSVANQPQEVNHGVSLVAFPNPSSGRITLQMEINRPDQLEILIYDLIGNPVWKHQGTVQLSAGMQNLEIDLQSYPQGTYQLVVKGSRFSRVLPVTLLK